MNITKKHQLEINIVLDNEEDMKLFFNVFDHPLIEQALGYSTASQLRPSITEGYDIKSQDKFNADFDKKVLEYADNLKTLKENS